MFDKVLTGNVFVCVYCRFDFVPMTRFSCLNLGSQFGLLLDGKKPMALLSAAGYDKYLLKC